MYLACLQHEFHSVSLTCRGSQREVTGVCTVAQPTNFPPYALASHMGWPSSWNHAPRRPRRTSCLSVLDNLSCGCCIICGVNRWMEELSLFFLSLSLPLSLSLSCLSASTTTFKKGWHKKVLARWNGVLL